MSQDPLTIVRVLLINGKPMYNEQEVELPEVVYRALKGKPQLEGVSVFKAVLKFK